jgi:hypothetical protein
MVGKHGKRSLEIWMLKDRIMGVNILNNLWCCGENDGN